MTNDKEPVAVSDALASSLGRLEQMAEAAKARRVELEAFAIGKESIACEEHGTQRPVDMDESSRATFNGGSLVLVYKPCPECAARERVLFRNRWLVNAGVPAILSTASFDNWTPRTEADKANLSACERFAEAPRGMLVMLGPNGVGKSHLAAAILRRRGRGKFYRQRKLLAELRATYGDSKRFQRDDIVKICQFAPFLVLDEMVQPESRDEWPMMEEILEYRHSEFMPTAITTNAATVNELAELMGARVFDRLRQSAFEGKLLQFTGESMRRQMRGKY